MNRIMKHKLTLLAGLLFASADTTWAAVTPHPLVCNGMVLQRDSTAPVWGWASPGEIVTVEFAGSKRTVTTDAGGKWLVKLKSMRASSEPRTLTIVGSSDGKQITISNVLVGEVWICSGQSNMEWPVKKSLNAEAEVQAANFTQIRMVTIRKAVSQESLDKPICEGNAWKEALSANVPDFSAVGYFFGRELHQTLNVPIGLIHTSWGGTPAEAWTSRATLESNPDLKPILDRAAASTNKFNQNSPCALYNAMLLPLAPYAVRGAVWYQGEGNGDRAFQYRTLLPAMIADWRKLWNADDFCFGIVSLANWLQPPATPVDSNWAELREAQAMTARMPHNGLAVAIDIGDAKDIHPKNKQEVGRRLSLWALAKVYGKRGEFSGPVYRSMKVEGDKIRLCFDHVSGGLIARNGPLKTFAIAGEDKVFHWAEAVIDGKTVMVSAREVSKPVAVRYAWAENPEGCNLYNQAGLPAVPFRTDSWPGRTLAAR